MQIFEKKDDASYRRTPKCGYCRQEGHNQYQCEEVGRHWEYWKTHTVPPIGVGYSYTRRNPRYWGEWYEKCSAIYHEQERRKNKPKITRTATRAASKCGFCREAGHNRRDCYHMRGFLEKCYKANENWRRAAYKHLVEEKGISVGACLEVKRRDGWGTNEKVVTEIAIVTEVNFDTLNVMTALYNNGYHTDNPYYSPLKVKVMINNEEFHLKFCVGGNRSWESWLKDLDELDSEIVQSIGSNGYYRNSFHYSKLLSRADHPLDEKWVTDYKGAFEYLTKKRSKEKLDNDGITKLINKWYKKD